MTIGFIKAIPRPFTKEKTKIKKQVHRDCRHWVGLGRNYAMMDTRSINSSMTHAIYGN